VVTLTEGQWVATFFGLVAVGLTMLWTAMQPPTEE
jgi:hypothetical protein